MEADILALENDDDTILLIVGDEGLKIKEEILSETDGSFISPDPEDTVLIKEEILDVTFEYPGYESEFNEELMPVSKVEGKDENVSNYVEICRDWEEKLKKQVRPGHKNSLVKELKQKHPELAKAKNKNKLIAALLEIMRSVKTPPLPQDYYIMNDIMLECMLCSGLSETIPAASRHYLEKHGPRYLFCYACGANYKSRTSLYVHEKRCWSPDRDVVLRARAVMLGNKGKTRPYLGLAKTFPLGSAVRKPVKINTFACDICPAVFQGKEALKSHIHLHQGLRPFKCKECDCAYTSRGALGRHVKRQHGDEQFECEHCGRIFKIKEGLVTHMETHRPRNLRKYPCEECGRRFAQKHTMLRHVERKHLKAPPPCICQLCPERFRRTTLLKEHMKKEHGVTLMTQKMFYKALPTMTDEEVQKAIAYKVL
ncbi:uncharacterized protein [Choristoneura fumiferana]|uniref:uncharacterized protein n=1 Tax=Choristoneura fumiferana TaxID=7141 RepID=UPI003D15CF22